MFSLRVVQTTVLLVRTEVQMKKLYIEKVGGEEVEICYADL